MFLDGGKLILKSGRGWKSFNSLDWTSLRENSVNGTNRPRFRRVKLFCDSCWVNFLLKIETWKSFCKIRRIFFGVFWRTNYFLEISEIFAFSWAFEGFAKKHSSADKNKTRERFSSFFHAPFLEVHCSLISAKKFDDVSKNRPKSIQMRLRQ